MPTSTFVATDSFSLQATDDVWTNVAEGTNVSRAIWNIKQGFVYVSDTFTANVGYVKFDTSEIPLDAEIVSATLGMYKWTGSLSRACIMGCYERVGTYPAAISGAGWDNNWVNPTTAASLTPLDSKTISITNAGWVTFDVSDAANLNDFAFIANEIKTNTSYTSSSFLEFRSAAYATDTSQRPYLEVTWVGDAIGFEHLDTFNQGVINAASGSGQFLRSDGPGLKRVSGAEDTTALILDGTGFKIKGV